MPQLSQKKCENSNMKLFISCSSSFGRFLCQSKFCFLCWLPISQRNHVWHWEWSSRHSIEIGVCTGRNSHNQWKIH